MENKVFAVACENYEKENIIKAYKELLLDNDLLAFVYPGMNIAIKANLVSASKPEEAIVTHPELLMALCEILVQKGAKVVVGDSPGGPFTEGILKSIYNKGNFTIIEQTGATLNHNFKQEQIDTPELKVIKHLDCCNWLTSADAIINFSKLKTHGMMSLSAATKNMFGAIPGTIKLEYHYRYPNHNDFANMLVDIQEHYQCNLHIIDAIDGMEGNGPTMGTPRHIGLLMASKSCYAADVVCCKIMNLDINQVPTVTQSIDRGLCPSSFEEVNLNMDITPYIIPDYKNIERVREIEFGAGKTKIGAFIVKKLIATKPKVTKKECIGCQKCANICPAKAIEMKNKKPVINRDICIRCFCCQEFCPVGAMKASRTPISKLLSKLK